MIREFDLIRDAAAYVRAENPKPQIGMILGSGWDLVTDAVEHQVRTPYSSVPGMKSSTVEGHAGEWVQGELSGKRVAIMSGRLHYYEGYSLSDITFPVRVLKEMGASVLIVTNAAGAVNTDYRCGDLMLIRDHINMTANNPLMGDNLREQGPRFPDMSTAYDRELRKIASQVAMEQELMMREGVYAQMTGPSFETPAEIRMLRAIGADAVGMSTVPEVIVARHAGMRVLGISCMTNMAAGVLDQPLSHQEVLDTAKRMRGQFLNYMRALVGQIS